MRVKGGPRWGLNEVQVGSRWGPGGSQVGRERPDLVYGSQERTGAGDTPSLIVFKKSLPAADWEEMVVRGDQAGSVVRGQGRPRWRPVGLWPEYAGCSSPCATHTCTQFYCSHCAGALCLMPP